MWTAILVAAALCIGYFAGVLHAVVEYERMTPEERNREEWLWRKN
jgi:hypothetical protein